MRLADLINRDKIIKVLEELENQYCIKDDFNSAFAVGYATVKVKKQPTVDIERHAHWTRVNDVFSQCSNCKNTILRCDTDNYCSHCGCKMKEVEK